MKTHAMLALLAAAVLACGSKNRAQDWSERPLDVTIEDQVGGVPFTIQAPKGMKREDGPADSRSRSWTADAKDALDQPWFIVSHESDPPRNLDGFVRNAMLDGSAVIAKTETTSDGFVLVHHNPEKTMAAARVLKRKGGANLTCFAQHSAGGHPMPSFDATIVWLEKLCRTLAIR